MEQNPPRRENAAAMMSVYCGDFSFHENVKCCSTCHDDYQNHGTIPCRREYVTAYGPINVILCCSFDFYWESLSDAEKKKAIGNAMKQRQKMVEYDYTRLLEASAVLRGREIDFAEKQLAAAQRQRFDVVDAANVALAMLASVPIGSNWSVRQTNRYNNAMRLLDHAISESRCLEKTQTTAATRSGDGGTGQA